MRTAQTTSRASLLFCLAATLSLAQTFHEYPTTTANSTPSGITAGPDGALWFTEPGVLQIGRITTSGAITEFPIPSSGTPGQITAGSDKNLWFTESGSFNAAGNALGLGRITPAGTVTEYAVPSGSSTNWIVSGPDGALWFTESGADANGTLGIGRITTSGAITEYDVPSGATPFGITAGADGALWFTDAGNNAIGRITTAGAVTEFPLPGGNSGPQAITSGPDGALWFTELSANQIGRITVAGVITEYAVPTANSSPDGIVTGPDHALWFAENTGGNIGRVTTSGVFSEFAIPTASSSPLGIALGPDANLWFTENAFTANQIGELIPPLLLSCDFSGPAIVGVAYSTTCKASSGTQPFHYSISSGSLPPGLAIASSTGAVTGTPTAAGAYSFTVQVTDSSSPAQAATQRVTNLTVVQKQTLTLTCGFSASAQVGTAYSATCSASGGVGPYTYSINSGALPPGLALNPSTGAITGTPTTSGAYSFTVRTADSESPALTAVQKESAFEVMPGTVLPLTIGCNASATAQVGVPYSAACLGSQGIAPYAYSIKAGSLPPGLALSPASGALAGIPATPGTFTFTVVATDRSSPAQSASRAVSITVMFGTVTQNGTPLFSLVGLPAIQTPGVNVPASTIQLNQSANFPISGTVTLGFNPNPSIPNLPSGYIDPAIQFLDSSGNKQGTIYSFTIPAFGTTVAMPVIDPGTVAGDVMLTLTMNGLTEVASTVTVDYSAPVIEPGSVQIVNATSDGFVVELVANSSSRDMLNATLTFTAASAAQIEGETTFTVDVSSVMSQWFASTPSLTYGSAFSVSIPFKLSGPVSAIQSVSATLTNSVGTSTAVSGTR